MNKNITVLTLLTINSILTIDGINLTINNVMFSVIVWYFYTMVYGHQALVLRACRRKMSSLVSFSNNIKAFFLRMGQENPTSNYAMHSKHYISQSWKCKEKLFIESQLKVNACGWEHVPDDHINRDKRVFKKIRLNKSSSVLFSFHYSSAWSFPL